MDWIRQNRFLTGYLGVLIVATLALGFHAFTGWRGDKVTSANYRDTANKVDALEKRPIFPKRENLEKKIGQVTAFGAAVDALQTQLIKTQRGLKSRLGEQGFRNLMDQEVAAISQVAAAKGMEIPEEFHFGLDAYESGKVINPRAIPLLEWEMDAIKQFVSLAAASGVDAIEEFERMEFPQEAMDWKSEDEIAAAAAEAASSKTANNRQRGRARTRGKTPPPVVRVSDNPMLTASKVMETYRFTAKVRGEHGAIQDLLNRIADDKTYFLWLRQLRIENETKRSPRQGDVPAPMLVPDTEPDKDGIAPMIDATLLFGDEKIYAYLVIDVVRFKDAPAPDGAG